MALKVQRDLANALSGSADGVALVVNYYQNSVSLGSRQLWHSDQLSNNTAWQTVSVVDDPAQRPAGTNRFSLALTGSFYSGWLAVDDVTAKQGTLTLASWDFSTPTWTAQHDNTFPAGKVWYGDVAGLLLPGDIPDPGRGHIDAPFTTPAGVSSFQVGTEVMLDQGWLAFNDLTLTAYSDPLPVTAGDMYQAMAQVTGAVTAGVGQGGRILAVYKDGSGQSAGSDVLWRNPLNFSGSTQVQDTFTTNPNAATMQLALESDLDAGHLTFSNLGLQHLTASDVIRRSTYSVGATAVKVQGDPDATKNGIFFLYSDHLGSTSVMSYGYNLNGSLHPQAGQVVAGSEARYLPFGGWRGTTPTAGLTDRGYTGHKSNNLGSNDLGLIYMNARFYAPGVSRFVTADTIIPNPANPQSFNRYSYTRNNPMTHT